ncbi:MAG: hypothetical protein QE164_03655 [Candidatus Nezhaarchaeota archaeon]|nr:hypothetical protein [Candidatus Nezhaarchaeota archaeon]
MIVGYILLILGYVGVIILCFKLNEVEQNTLYLVAGIMFIIAIFISIVGFVAWILLYVALGDSIKNALNCLKHKCYYDSFFLML